MARNISEITKINFAKQLNAQLQKKYNKKVSVVFFVNQFNLRSYGTAPIAYETGRKWLNGFTIPQLSSMEILVNWLNIDVNHIFTKTTDQEVKKNDVTNFDGNIIINELISPKLLNLIHAISLELDPKHLSFLFFAALTIKELSEKNDFDFNFESFIKILNLKINTIED